MEESKVEGKYIGEITHFFPHVSAAVVKLVSDLKVGDKIKIVAANGDEFEQDVSTIQIDRTEIEQAKKGDEVGLKVDQKVHEGMKIYLV